MESLLWEMDRIVGEPSFGIDAFKRWGRGIEVWLWQKETQVQGTLRLSKMCCVVKNVKMCSLKRNSKVWIEGY